MLRPVVAVGTILTALLLSACGSEPEPASSPIASSDPLAGAPAAPPATAVTPSASPAPSASRAPAAGAPARPSSIPAVPRSSPAPRPKAAAKPAPAKPTRAKATQAALSRPAGKKIPVELTGYSFHDNTPKGSPAVCCGVLHKTASGKGTFADPITAAVSGSGSSMAFKPGTRFYLPKLQRYVIVEDSGASSGTNHLDVWIDGRDGSKSVTDACMDRITGDSTGELNPPPGRPVIVGPIFSGGKCRLPSPG